MSVNITLLIVSIIICELAGAIGSIFTMKSIPKWYSKLKKPSFNPPNWVFGPVWTTLFFLMGISLYLIWNIGIGLVAVNIAIQIFYVQLILNVLWSVIFFGFKSPFLAFIEIILLWLSILLTIMVFFPLSHLAAYLLVPYIVWVSVAAVLNFSIWRLNRKKN